MEYKKNYTAPRFRRRRQQSKAARLTRGLKHTTHAAEEYGTSRSFLRGFLPVIVTLCLNSKYTRTWTSPIPSPTLQQEATQKIEPHTRSIHPSVRTSCRRAITVRLVTPPRTSIYTKPFPPALAAVDTAGRPRSPTQAAAVTTQSNGERNDTTNRQTRRLMIDGPSPSLSRANRVTRCTRRQAISSKPSLLSTRF